MNVCFSPTFHRPNKSKVNTRINKLDINRPNAITTLSKELSILNYIASRNSWLILVIENNAHRNARGLSTSRKHMTIRNDALDRCFDLNDCVKTCNMSKYIEYGRLKILFQKITQPLLKAPLNRKPI